MYQPKKLTLFIFLFLLFSTALMAQTNTGNVSGKVYDASTGETLIGAAVYLELDPATGVSTDLDGKFILQNIGEGTYTLVCSFISYQTKQISDVTIKAGETLNLDITMQAASEELTTVVITSSARQESIQSILTIQKNNISISDGISKDIINRSPDRNTSEVLRRMSGTTIIDNKFAVIRGLSDRYNIALINGIVLPSSEPDKKNFSFDLVPSALLDNLFIYKTAQPDLPGDFAGGIIQLNTNDIPDQNFLQISSGAGINTTATFKEYLTYNGGTKDWLGVDDGTRALPVGFPSSEAMQNGGIDQQVQASKLMLNNWGAYSKPSTPMNTNFQLSGGMNFPIHDSELGFLASVTYNNNYSYLAIERNDYLNDGSVLFTYDDDQYRQNILNGALLNISYKINQNNKISLKNSVSVNATDITTQRYGFTAQSGNDVDYQYLEFISNKLVSNILTGSHYFNASKIKIDWNAGVNNLTRDQPDLRTSFYIKAPEDSTYYTFFSINNATPEGNFKYYSYLKEKNNFAGVHVTLPVQVGASTQNIKVGGTVSSKNREFDSRLMGYTISNLFYQVSDAFSYLALPRDEIFADQNIADSLFFLKDVTKKSDSYTSQETNNAVYVMLDNKVFNRLRIVWGVRSEFFRQKLQSYENSGSSNPEEVNVDTKENDTVGLSFDLLPSVNIIYSLNESINIRISGSKTVARPGVRELAPLGYYDYENAYYFLGNPGLLASDIYNGDLRLEYFLGLGQVISVTGFYKLFNNPIELRRYSTGVYTQIDPINEERATNIGAEFELRKNFGFINEESLFFKNLVFNTNLAYIKSIIQVTDTAYFGVAERPLQGQSPYVLNFGLTYLQPEKFTFTVLYNKIGRRITELGYKNYPDIYQNPRPLLDAQASIFFFKGRGNIKINYADILASDDIFYQDIDTNGKFDENIDQVITRYIVGSRITTTLSYKF